MISGSTAALRSSVTPSAQHRGEQHLLGGADARVRQLELGAVQAVGGRQVQALRGLVDDRAELAQRAEVEVDRPAADVAAAEVRDERVAEAVQQRAAEQDRDAAGAGVHVDLVDVGALDVGRVEQQLAGSAPSLTRTPCSSSRPRTTSTSRMRGTSRRRLGVSPRSGGDHRLGDEVLRAADADLAAQRGAAVHDEDVIGQRNLAGGSWVGRIDYGGYRLRCASLRRITGGGRTLCVAALAIVREATAGRCEAYAGRFCGMRDHTWDVQPRYFRVTCVDQCAVATAGPASGPARRGRGARCPGRP